MNRAYYRKKVSDFLTEDRERILGALAENHAFALDIAQRNAWIEQIANLQAELAPFPYGEIFLEFAIPRMGKRVDAVLLVERLVFVLEYKVGAKAYERHGIDQVLDYALDLKNFHEGSHDRTIIPILIATRGPSQDNQLIFYQDGVARPLLSNGANLGALIGKVLGMSLPQQSAHYGFAEAEQEDYQDWAESGYKPTPTIIEAAQALYQGHAVEEISRSDAGAKNLTETADCIVEIIEHAREAGRKSICFVTGVPGAGKTLAGLNIATRNIAGADEHAVFLSGNGPLVAVLREALARDEVARLKESDTPTDKKAALQKVSSFIQNIHHFRDEGLRSEAPPHEHVVIFDEAQRAWNQAHAEKFMVQKRGAASFEMSEPEFLISLMDRRQDWCAIVCLIGNGQEINTGEAGLVEWFNALRKRFHHWDVYHSGQLTSSNQDEDLDAELAALNAIRKPALHLSVSLRSYRAEKLSDFVAAVIDGEAERARQAFATLTNYPLMVTRDLGAARQWLRAQARGTERIGLVASSGAMRLKPEGIHVRAGIDPASWFLNGKDDIRSSYYLEDVATEFDIQGLELDWTGMCWDGDFRMERDGWGFYAFKGTRWQNVKDAFRRMYLANAYRVLLTRARQGMVIFVPKGSPDDETRPPAFYDGTYMFLRACGIPELSPSVQV